MEKTLLPQHLQTLYNSVMKSIDNNYNERRYTEQSSSTESAATGPAFNNQTDLTAREKCTSDLTEGSRDVQREEKELSKNGETRNSFETNSSESVYRSTERNGNGALVGNCILDKNSHGAVTLKSTNSEQTDCHSLSNDAEQTKDSVPSAERNGSCNNNDIVVFSSEGDNSQEPIAHSVYRREMEECISSEESKQGLLQHSADLTLLRHYADLKSQYLMLQERVEHLVERNRMLEVENKGEIFAGQIETLEKTINRLTFELHASLEIQETLKKEYNAANKERESMVMKYAVSEEQLIDTQRYAGIFIRIIQCLISLFCFS